MSAMPLVFSDPAAGELNIYSEKTRNEQIYFNVSVIFVRAGCYQWIVFTASHIFFKANGLF